MSPASTIYAEIATKIRRQELPSAPVDHQREELLYRLSCMDDPKMREYGIRELNNIRSRKDNQCYH